MNQTLKLRLISVATLLVVIVVTYRCWRAFHDAAPDWIRLERRHSPTLPSEFMPAFKNFRQQLDTEAKRYSQPVKSLLFYAIGKGGQQMLVGDLVTLYNPGFTPVAQLTVPHWTSDPSIYGCYTLDGVPLAIQLKHHPSNPKVASFVVELQEPLAPGATLPVLYVEQRPLTLRSDAAGNYTQYLPRVPRDDTAICAVAICLPARATIKNYQPDDGAYFFRQDMRLIGWINSRLDPKAGAPAVTFRLP